LPILYKNPAQKAILADANHRNTNPPNRKQGKQQPNNVGEAVLDAAVGYHTFDIGFNINRIYTQSQHPLF